MCLLLLILHLSLLHAGFTEICHHAHSDIFSSLGFLKFFSLVFYPFPLTLLVLHAHAPLLRLNRRVSPPWSFSTFLLSLCLLFARISPAPLFTWFSNKTVLCSLAVCGRTAVSLRPGEFYLCFCISCFFWQTPLTSHTKFSI